VTFSDLLRLSVLITGGEATVLGAITAIGISDNQDERTLYVALAWWLVAVAVGLWLGRPWRAAEDMRDVLARAKTATSLPPESAARIAIGRLWPMALFAIGAGVLGIVWPGVAAIGAGYALLVSIAWHNREGAVLAIEQRDGVKFYVVPTNALRPIELVRAPGLRTEARNSYVT
jgi:ABC-type Fe3+ transport system permease subunit